MNKYRNMTESAPSMNFSTSRLPRITFGAGAIRKLPALALEHGRQALLVTGGNAIKHHPAWEPLLTDLRHAGLDYTLVSIATEPSPELVDAAARQYRQQAIDVVIGIGGGSVLDAAKAIAGLLRVDHSVMDFLEGVGPELAYPGPALPFIAVPTTAGTGSEATKNAVLSTQGTKGFKKSFRDEQLVASHALVDPDLLTTCPPALIAANGMDALTQLIESYVSRRANPFTDALASDALRRAGDSLIHWYLQEDDSTQARANMAYCALVSGITLAQVGLGSVHGLASPLGAFFPIPHGVACGTLVAEATRVNIEAMQQRQPQHLALTKYAHIASLLTGDHFPEPAAAHRALIALLADWTAQMQIPRLGHYGVTATDQARIVANSRGSSMQTNPIVLEDTEIAALVAART